MFERSHREISNTMGDLMHQIQQEMESEVIAMIFVSPNGSLGLTFPANIDRATVIRALQQILDGQDV